MSDGPAATSAAPPPLPPEAFAHWYGPWEPLDPTSIATFMDGFDRPWGIIGGWSIEAFLRAVMAARDSSPVWPKRGLVPRWFGAGDGGHAGSTSRRGHLMSRRSRTWIP